MDPCSTRSQSAARSMFQPQVSPESQDGRAWEGPQWLIPSTLHWNLPGFTFLVPSTGMQIHCIFRGYGIHFQNWEFKTTWCRKLFPSYPLLTTELKVISTKIRTVWLLESPCCCLAKFAAEEFLCPLIIPTDTGRWTCERTGLCQGLFPFLTDIQ